MIVLPPDLGSLLAYIGTAAFASWVVSNVLENLTAFQALTAQAKNIVILIAYIVLGVLSYLLILTVPTSLIAQLQPLYAVVLASITAYVSGTWYHAQTKPAPATVTQTTQSSSTDGTVMQQTEVKADVPTETPMDMRTTPPLGIPLPTVEEQAKLIAASAPKV
jgi:hypothetical protein